METNEIKKALYKRNPVAEIISINKAGIRYITYVKLDGGDVTPILFLIPFDDIGDAIFTSTMEAKFLIRYIQ